METTLPCPLFDADNHLHETQDSLTRFLPAAYQDAISYVQTNGRTKIAVRSQISGYVPIPPTAQRMSVHINQELVADTSNAPASPSAGSHSPGPRPPANSLLRSRAAIIWR